MKQKAFPEFKSKKALLNTFFFLVVSCTQNGFEPKTSSSTLSYGRRKGDAKQDCKIRRKCKRKNLCFTALECLESPPS